MDKEEFEKIVGLVDSALKERCLNAIKWKISAGNIEEFDFIKMKNISDFENVVEVDFIEKKVKDKKGGKSSD